MLAIDFLPADAIAKQLSARAKLLRLSRNIGQDELAERAGVSLGTVRRFERGEAVSLENFVRIVQALGRANELSALLVNEPVASISDMERLSAVQGRRRAWKRRRQ